MPASSFCHTPRCRPMFSSFQESFVPLSSIQAVHDRTMTTRFLCMICFALLRAALDGRLDFAAAPPSCGEASCGWPYLAAKLPRPRVSAHRESAWPGFSMAASGFSKRDTYAHSHPSSSRFKSTETLFQLAACKGHGSGFVAAIHLGRGVWH